MKGLLKFLMGIVLGAGLGWALGYLRFPAIERNASFWVGGMAGLAVAGLVAGMEYLWRQHRVVVRTVGRGGTGAVGGAGTGEVAGAGTGEVAGAGERALRAYSILWACVGLFIVLGAGASGYLISRQNRLLETRSAAQDEHIREQNALIASIRTSNQVLLMSNVLEQVAEELEGNPERKLSAATRASVVALSYSFKPYPYVRGDSVTSQSWSPERGQLLLALTLMGMDSASFADLKREAVFAGADLGGADLRGADLRGAHLKGAILKDAVLRGADLRGADLRAADLWGANLDSADLRGASFVRADLRWAELNGAVLGTANLNGADLRDAKLRGADLRGATVRWSDAGGAMFNGADVSGVDLLGTNLAKANLTGVNLRESNLRLVNFGDAHLEGVDLLGAFVGKENWDNVLIEWQLAGGEEFRRLYQVVQDTSRRYEALFRLEAVR